MAAAFFVGFLPAIGISISFWPGAAFFDFFITGFFDVSAGPRHFDGLGRFQRHVLSFVLGHSMKGVGIYLVTLDDALMGDLLAGVGIDWRT